MHVSCCTFVVLLFLHGRPDVAPRRLIASRFVLKELGVVTVAAALVMLPALSRSFLSTYRQEKWGRSLPPSLLRFTYLSCGSPVFLFEWFSKLWFPKRGLTVPNQEHAKMKLTCHYTKSGSCGKIVKLTGKGVKSRLNGVWGTCFPHKTSECAKGA